MKGDKHDETPLTDRDILIRGAAEALLADPQVGREIAGCNTAKFVSTVRPIYVWNGFNFNDNDLRDIHEMLRELVVRKQLGGNHRHLVVN